MNNIDDEKFDDYSHRDDVELRKLVETIRRSEKFFLHFVICNQVPRQNEIIEVIIKKKLPLHKILIVNFQEPITDLLGELNKRINGKKYDAIFIQSLFYSIKSDDDGKNNKLIHNLNITRDRFAKELSCPIYLWIPEYSFTIIARNAPDFFSVRSGSYTFSPMVEKIDDEISQFTTSVLFENSSFSLQEKRERTQKLRGLLSEYEGLHPEKRSKNTEINLLSDLGDLSYQLSNFGKADEYYNQLVNLAKEIKNKKVESITLSKLANIAIEFRHFDEVKRLGLKSFAISKKINDVESYCRATLTLGLLFSRQENYEKAICFYKGCLKKSREANFRAGEGSSLGNLGQIYKILGENEKGIDYQNQALQIAREVNNKNDEIVLLTQLSSSFEISGNYLKCIEYLTNAVQISREIGNRKREGESLVQLGIVYSKLNSKKYAIECLSNGIPILESIGYPDTNFYKKKLADLRENVQRSEAVLGLATILGMIILFIFFMLLLMFDQAKDTREHQNINNKTNTNSTIKNNYNLNINIDINKIMKEVENNVMRELEKNKQK